MFLLIDFPNRQIELFGFVLQNRELFFDESALFLAVLSFAHQFFLQGLFFFVDLLSQVASHIQPLANHAWVVDPSAGEKEEPPLQPKLCK